MLAGKAVLPHLLVGARGTALAALQIRLFDDDKDTTRSGHLDVGPIIGTAAGWGRLSASATAGPLATRITHDDHTRWTVGLGLDAGIAARIHGAVALGIHGFSNVNAEETALGVGLRLEASFSR